MFGSRQVGFAGTGLQPESCLDRCFGLRQPLRGMIDAQEVKVVVCECELALREQERWVADESLVQKIGRLEQILAANGAEARGYYQSFRSAVEIKGSYVGCRRLFDLAFFTR